VLLTTRSRHIAWILAIGSVIVVDLITADAHPIIRMFAIIVSLFFSMKVLVYVEELLAGGDRLSFGAWLAFVGWVGMRPGIFRSLGQTPLKGGGDLIRSGLQRLLFGGILLAGTALFYEFSKDRLSHGFRFAIAAAALLPALSLILHFGILNIAAGFWRIHGVDVRSPFRAPLLSRSLGEFWSRRWNLPFSELATVVIVRPLSPFGRTTVGFAAFLFSGILHELAISVPVNAGYGRLSIYFLLHGCAIYLETVFARNGFPIREHIWFGRIWTAAWLIIPLPLLFHPPFLRGVVLPLAGL